MRKRKKKRELTNENLREWLNEYIEQNGVKLSFIAKKSNINYVNLSKFKNGHMGMRPSTLLRLAKALEK